MVKTPFRFIHAADLNLELPVEGCGEGSDAIEQRLINAPLEAAKRLFQLAQAEVVDFVILSGNVINPNISGVNPLVFLVEQFEILNKAGIPIYWAGGEYDGPENWPPAIILPENVHFFRTGNVEEHVFYKGNAPVARLIGFSRGNRNRMLKASEFSQDASGLYTIAVGNGRIDPSSAKLQNIPYWALGGNRKRSTSKFDTTKLDSRRARLDSHNSEPKAKQEKKSQLPETKKRDIASTLVPQENFSVQTETDLLPTVIHYPGTTLARSPIESGQN
ncbi:MAG: metallophosphoesterase family protein, partial [Thermoguttaceae bacterium]